MKRKAIITALASMTIIPLLVTSCITVVPPSEPAATSPKPAAPSTPSTPEPTQPTVSPEQAIPSSWEELSSTDFANQITILEWPNQAHAGDFITIRVKTMSNEFWEWLEEELIKANQWDYLDAVGKEATYELALCGELPGGGLYESSLGITTPDDDLIASWYVSIPTMGYSYEYNADEDQYEYIEGSLLPGNYKMELRLLDPCDNSEGFCGYGVMTERNIIVKE